jgi:mono/diheme cytochrome c family protein
MATRKQGWLGIVPIVGAVVFGGALIVGAAEEWKAPADAAAKKNPVASNDESVAAGKEAYDGQCVECHGVSGKNDGKKISELKKEEKDRMKVLSDPVVTKQSDGELFWKISEGKKPMPAGKKLMEEEEMWSVVNYIRTFSHK